MTIEQERDAWRTVLHAHDQTAEPDAGQVEHHAPPKSTEIPAVYAVGSQRGPRPVQLRAAYRQLAMELTEWHH